MKPTKPMQPLLPPAPHHVSLPWAQTIWDAPVAPSMRDTLLNAFAAPTLDPADRSVADPKAVVSLAVVLDLLATRLRPLPPGPTVLAQAAEQAVAVGMLGGANQDAVCVRLLALSHSPTADARAAFVGAFAHAVTHVLDASAPAAKAAPGGSPATAAAETETETTTITTTAAATTPKTVAQALARVTQATTLIVREAELLLAQRRARSSWQA